MDNNPSERRRDGRMKIDKQKVAQSLQWLFRQ
jgi:hypothetical protein